MTKNERIEIFLGDSSISHFPGLADALAQYEEDNRCYLTEFSPGNYTIEYPLSKKMVLGRIGEFFFAGINHSENLWGYEFFNCKSDMKSYFNDTILVNEPAKNRRYWVSEIDSIPVE